MSEVVVHDRRMSAYEEKVWAGLGTYWDKRNSARGLPNWASDAIERGGVAARNGAGRVVEKIPEPIKAPIRRASNAVADAAIKPAFESAVALLNLVNDWVLELNDPEAVERLARKRGFDIEAFTDLRWRDLRDCDRLLTLNTLRWRSAGAVEGGAMGALALVPVAGIPIAITADIVVVQALSASIAARVAYSYGYDAKDPEEQEFIQRIVRRSFIAQAAKAGPIRDASRAAWAAKDRVRWSNKLRTDHRLLAALEKLMQQVGVNGGRVSVQSVAKVVPFVGIVIGAGVNAAVLGQLAEDAKRYCQTRFLSEKYELPMPTALLEEDDETFEDRA